MPDRIDLADATGADGPDDPVSGERLTNRERPLRLSSIECDEVPGEMRPTIETLVTRLFRDARIVFRPDRRHGIASAHFTCPSKPSDVAMAR
jgi:hypothetical protein